FKEVTTIEIDAVETYDNSSRGLLCRVSGTMDAHHLDFKQV
nr:hypothetical protein [Tanacetum cinerariifolium]